MLTLLRWGRAEYEDTGLEGLPPDVQVLEDSTNNPPFEEAEVLVVPSKRKVDATVVARLRRCRLVITTTSGFDHLDLGALTAAGIPAARLPLARRDAVVQTALGMLLALGRRLPVFSAAAVENRWMRGELRQVGATVLGTVGVVGRGVIGARMVEVLEGLGCRVLVCDPRFPETLPLEMLLREADAITLHCALNASTRKLFDEGTIARMRAGSLLVNTARGPLVEVQAAREAVRAGHLAGMGLDVFPEEPCSLLPYVDPHILVSPHAAGWFPALGAACAVGVATAVSALLAGEEIPFRIEAEEQDATGRCRPAFSGGLHLGNTQSPV